MNQIERIPHKNTTEKKYRYPLEENRKAIETAVNVLSNTEPIVI